MSFKEVFAGKIKVTTQTEQLAEKQREQELASLSRKGSRILAINRNRQSNNVDSSDVHIKISMMEWEYDNLGQQPLRLRRTLNIGDVIRIKLTSRINK